MFSSQPEIHEYKVSVRTNELQEAIALTGNALYSLMEEALQLHEHEAEECEFEAFARDVLGVLGRHADQLTRYEGSWDSDNEGSYRSDEPDVEVT